MTLGAGLDLSGGDLAYLMSAQEDRMLADATSGVLPQASPSLEVNRQLDPSDGVNYAGGSSHTPGLPLLPSSVGLTGVMGAGINQDHREAMESLCGGLAGANGLFETIGKTDTYLMLMNGKPWPTPLRQGPISAGYVTPTVMSRLANINQGWNAAAQPGAAPGLNVGYSDKTLGPSTWQEAMEYSPSPLLDKIGSLQGLGAIVTGASDPGLRKVLDAAAKPGTQKTGAVARELIKQSVKLGNLTGKRAAVMENARKKYSSLVRKVANIDSQTQLIANKLFDAEGEPHPSVSVADIRSYRKLRQKGFKLGREAIRYQKTNILATGLTKNGYAQAKLLQDMAMTMTTGRPKTTAVLAAQFEMIGQESKGLRAQRGLQVARWKSKTAEERVKSLEGLSGLDAVIDKALSADYWEADLAGMEFYEMAYLGALEGLWGSIKKAARKVGKVAKKAVKITKKVAKVVHKKSIAPIKKAVKTARKVGRAARKAGRTAYRAGKAVSRGKFRKAGRIATRAAGRAAKSLYRRAKRQYKKSVRKVSKAVSKARKFGKSAYKTASAISKPVWKSMKATARVAIAPVKMSYNVGRNVARGDFRGAANSISRSVKETANNIAASAGSITFGVTCAFDRTPLGKATAKAVGQAVGTYFGGRAGGAVGHEAGRKANEASRGICTGMDRVGLTRGRVRPNQIGPAFKKTAVYLAKKTFAPKELLKSGINIGMNYAAGGGGGASLAKEFVKKGVSKFATEQAKELGKKYVRGQIETEIQAKINQSPELRSLSKYTPAIKAAYQGVQAFRGGEVDMDALKGTLRQQGAVALKKYGPQVAEGAVGQIAGRRAGDFVGTAGRVAAMTPRQRAEYFKRQASSKGQRLAAQATREIAGRRAGEIVGGATTLRAMAPAQRQAFLRRQALAQARSASPQATAAARRAQALARMPRAQRQAYLRRQATRAQAARRRASPQVMRNRAIARARAVARQRMGVPGALLRA